MQLFFAAMTVVTISLGLALPTHAEETAAAAAVQEGSNCPHSKMCLEKLMWAKDIKVNAFVSTAYTANLETSDPNVSNVGRVFDGANNTLGVDVAELVIQKEATNPGDAGFRMDLVYGSSVPVVGAFPESDLTNHSDVALQQAFVSYIAPVGSGLRLDAGTFVTHVGAELIEGYDGYNDNYSRGFLFGYAIPFVHTGVKGTYNLSSNLSLMGMVSNSWTSNRLDSNKGKTWHAMVNYKPMDMLNIYVNYIGGPEKALDPSAASSVANDRDLRHLVDVVAIIKPMEKLTLTLNGDYGTQANKGKDSTQWFGVAGYVRYDVCSAFWLTLRGEYFDDTDGFAGFGDKMMEATLTPTYKVSDNFLVRADLRYDKAQDTNPFPGARSHQTTAAINAIFVY